MLVADSSYKRRRNLHLLYGRFVDRTGLSPSFIAYGRSRPTAELGIFCESGQKSAHLYLADCFAHVICQLTLVSAVLPTQE
jgi:hypothetical protein